MTTRFAKSSGFRSGISSALKGGANKSAPASVRREVGSVKSDRDARYKDVSHVRDDVGRGRRAALGS